MSNSSSGNDFITNFGLTIQDWLQYALPGLVVVIAIFFYNINPFQYTIQEILAFTSKVNILSAIFILIISYCIGQIIASFTHILDLITKRILKNQSFNTPINFSKIQDSVRYEVYNLAYQKALKEINVAFDLSEVSFNVIREYMLYVIMKNQYKMYADIRRYRSVAYYRKHMVLALSPYILVAVHYQIYTLLIFVIILISFYFWGYKSLYRRTFLDRIPLSYLVTVSSMPETSGENIE